MDAHERLITSTQQLLWERGYVAMSPKAIQQRAGVGQGSMYHHFAGKSELAAAAVARSAEQLIEEVRPIFDGPGTAIERISGYLRRERDVLKGCRIGGLTQDPEIIADPTLRAPVEQTFTWLRHRIGEVIAEGQAGGEMTSTVPPEQAASMICAVLQGGYVLARAQGDTAPFDEAIDGAIALISGLAEPAQQASGSSTRAGAQR